MSRSISGKIKINSFADIVGGDDTAVTEVNLRIIPFACLTTRRWTRQWRVLKSMAF